MRTLLALLISLLVCVQGQHPGLSMSLDLTAVSQAKDAYLAQILRKLNGLPLPNITLAGGDGHVRSNKIFVKQQAKNVDLVVNSTRDSYAVKVRNLYLFMRSQDFRYNLWFVPVKATLDVEVASVGLDFEVQLGNTTLNTTLPSWEILTRTLPQIQVTRCELQLDPKKMSFNIGGSMIAQLVDVVVPLFTRLISVILEDRVRSLVTQEELPSLFNDAVLGSQGFFTLGEMAGKAAWGDATLDYAVDNFNIVGTQLQIAINGTVFNNKTTGYRVLPVPLPLTMPFQDPTIEASWQVFVSTYFLEHLSTTFLAQAPFQYYYAWDSNQNPLFWLTTSSCEAFFPQLVQQFGPAIPIDLNFRILQAHNFNSTPGQLSLQLAMQAEALLHQRDGSRLKFGLLEFLGGQLSFSVHSEGMLLKGAVNAFTFDSVFASTTYGVQRYEQSPYLANIVLYGALLVVNEDFLDQNLVRVPDRWGYFNMEDLCLQYYDDYVALGITPWFKVYNATDWKGLNGTQPQ